MANSSTLVADPDPEAAQTQYAPMESPTTADDNVITPPPPRGKGGKPPPRGFEVSVHPRSEYLVIKHNWFQSGYRSPASLVLVVCVLYIVLSVIWKTLSDIRTIWTPTQIDQGRNYQEAAETCFIALLILVPVIYVGLCLPFNVTTIRASPSKISLRTKPFSSQLLGCSTDKDLEIGDINSNPIQAVYTESYIHDPNDSDRGTCYRVMLRRQTNNNVKKKKKHEDDDEEEESDDDHQCVVIMGLKSHANFIVRELADYYKTLAAAEGTSSSSSDTG